MYEVIFDFGSYRKGFFISDNFVSKLPIYFVILIFIGFYELSSISISLPFPSFIQLVLFSLFSIWSSFFLLVRTKRLNLDRKGLAKATIYLVFLTFFIIYFVFLPNGTLVFAATTSITGPAAGSWQRTDYTVTVDDTTSGTATCRWNITDDGTFRTEGTRTCPDGSFTITVGASANCRVQGENKCRGSANATDDGIAGSATRLFSTDYTAPLWFNNATSRPSGIGYLSGANYGFQITWNDSTSSIFNVTFEFDGSNYTNKTTPSIINVSGSFNGSVFFINFTDLAARTYNFRWIANDTANNVNSTPIINYNISNSTTLTSIFINGTAGNRNIPRGSFVNVTGTSNVSTLTVRIYANYTGSRAQINSSTGAVFNLTNTGTIAAGPYEALANTTGNQNYTNSESSTLTLFVAHTIITPNSTARTYRRGDFMNITIDPRSFYATAINATLNASLVKPNNVVLQLNLSNFSSGLFTTNYTFATDDPLGSYMINTTGNGTISAGLITNSTNVSLVQLINITIESNKKNADNIIISRANQIININGTANYSTDGAPYASRSLTFLLDSTTLGTNNTNANGFYEFNFKVSLDGTYTLNVTATDATSNSGSNSTTVKITTLPDKVRYRFDYRIGTTKTNDVYKIGNQNASVGSTDTTRKFTPQNSTLNRAYVCTYDEVEYARGLVVALFHSFQKSQLSYVQFNNSVLLNNYSLELEQPVVGSSLIIPVTNGTCKLIDDKASLVESNALPSSILGSFVLGLPREYDAQILGIYDRIELNGTDKFGAGSHRICVEKTGVGLTNKPIVKVGFC